ncbi:MAG: ABC transporter ATP-binding protein/permease [Chloroflexi bacterium]|nr:ABC transporter ATP-binding protein/permease [Chloroflexota bacterium]
MAILRRMSSYLKPYLSSLVLLLVCMVAGLLAELFMPRILGYVIDRGISQRSMPNVLRYAGLLALLAVVRAALRYGQMITQERLGQETVRSLRRDLYARLQQLSFTFYSVNNTGDLMSRLTNDVSAIMDFFGFGISEMMSSILIFTGTLVMLLIADWRLALVVCAPIPVLMFFAFRFSGVVGPAWEKIREQMGKLSTTLQENISGVRVVKSYGREHHEIHKFADMNESTLDANIDRADIEARTFPVMSFITGISFLLLYWYGGRRVINGQLSMGTFFSFNWYLWSLIYPVRFLGFLISLAQKAIASGPRVFAVLDSKLEIPEAADSQPLPVIQGLIRFEDVHFAFEDGDGTPVLRGLNLEIQPGQVVAVLGGTGSGKSSLINLIPRFYDPQEGRITVDGTDLRRVTLNSLRQQIGIVPQETYLFSDTVRNNIAFGRPDATDAEVEAAAQAAQAHEFIAQLPKGYETRVGERGLGLSGGQKQRIAIARALLTDPRILILDEATSSVDAETEHTLQLALDEVMRGRTSIVIAQRLSTVRNADVVMVLKDGLVVERGTHEELLAQGGEYARIYNLQLRPQEVINAQLDLGSASL